MTEDPLRAIERVETGKPVFSILLLDMSRRQRTP